MHELTYALSESASMAVMGFIAFASVGAVLFAVWRALVHGARLRNANRAAERASTLREGHAVIAGTAQTEEGDPAIVLEVSERGTEQRVKGGWSHQWTETARELSVQPFELVLDSGERVTVVPDENVLVIDKLVVAARPSRERRVRRAELTQGERCYVEGELRREGEGKKPVGYRTAAGRGPTWVLRGSRGVRLLVSSRPLPERHERWVQYWTAWAIVLAIVALATGAFAYQTYWKLALHGVPVRATITALDRHETRDGVSYVVTAIVRRPDGSSWELSDVIRREAWQRLQVGDSIPFVVVPRQPTVHHVQRAGVSSGWPLMFGFAVFILAIAFLATRSSQQRWYEMKVIGEGGGGRLDDPPAS